jgi:mono/diheme cytochrome c family protein
VRRTSVVLTALVAFVLTTAAILAQPPRKITVELQRTHPTNGAAMYQQYCGSCHGPNGAGNGQYAGMLSVQPTDLTQLKRLHGGRYPAVHVRGVLEWGTGHANTPMPMWAGRLSRLDRQDRGLAEIRMQNLINHIETLQQ